jgi:thiamine biosynthesis lipoprotein
MSLRTTSFDAIGTKWTIEVMTVISDNQWHEIQGAINDRISEFDTRYSRFRSDSLVSKMGEQSGSYPLDSDGYTLLKLYESLYQLSDGILTPLIGRVMEDSGYDASYSLIARDSLASPPSWNATLTYSKTKLVIKQPVLLDFGAAGKGYLVDTIGAIIEAHGVHEYVINAGGDLMQRAKNNQPITIGLENPVDTSQAIGTVKVSNKSLCASSGSRRKWGKYHHIINPKTLESPRKVLATWVIAEDTMTADGLATALFFVSAKKLQQTFNFSYAFLSNDMSLEYAPDFPITVFGTAP